MASLQMLSSCIGTNRSRLDGLIDKLATAAGFIVKDMAIALSYKFQFFFQFLRVLFAVAVIYFIGKMLSDSGSSPLLQKYHADYFSFALVGLAIGSYLKAGLVTVTNDLRQTMNQGVLEAMCATPSDYNWLLFCMTLWPFLFETIRITCYFLVGMVIFGMRFHQANWSGAAATIVLTVPIFLMLGMTSCSILVLIKRGDPINWIFSSVSSLLAGTMFPIDVLPNWLRAIALCLPLTHSLEAARKCLLAGAALRQVGHHLGALVLFILVLLPVTVLVNGICMKQARRRGAFSTH
jgi:ABC-2 type transport system permease protein